MIPTWVVGLLTVWGVGSAILLICQGIETREELGRGMIAFTRKEAVLWSLFWWVALLVMFVGIPLFSLFMRYKQNREFERKLGTCVERLGVERSNVDDMECWMGNQSVIAINHANLGFTLHVHYSDTQKVSEFFADYLDTRCALKAIIPLVIKEAPLTEIQSTMKMHSRYSFR